MSTIMSLDVNAATTRRANFWEIPAPIAARHAD
jgi:hypothetical protein